MRICSFYDFRSNCRFLASLMMTNPQGSPRPLFTRAAKSKKRLRSSSWGPHSLGIHKSPLRHKRELHHFRSFLFGRFELPVLDRIQGGFDQHWISADRIGAFDMSVRRNHHP